MLDELKEGRAVYWDITHTYLQQKRKIAIDEIEPEKAGENLVGIAETHELVLYETFTPDIIGHKKAMEDAREYLILFDRFLSAVCSHKTDVMTIVLCSDHGNIEDLSTGSHTTNPVILLVIGPGAHYFREARDLSHITPLILRVIAGRSASH
jgi:bisphosphoglycerate-independent phosphoglycerate mutase (AlkP superfamily)